MDAVTLYYKVLPWFWKIEWIPCFHQYPCASKYFGWSFLFAEIWRISYTGWFQCCEWDNTHPCILSCCHGLVTDAICSKIKRVAVDFAWGSSTRAPRAAVTAARWAVILVGRRRGLRVATAAWRGPRTGCRPRGLSESSVCLSVPIQILPNSSSQIHSSLQP